MRKYLSLILVVLLVLVGAGSSLAAPPPPYLTYQGHLYDVAGVPAADGDYMFTFSLWATGMGGEMALWGPETHALAVRNGYFAATLGQQQALPALPGTVYLEIAVNGEILSPRQPLQSVAFALNAQDSVQLAGQVADYYRDWNYTLNLPVGFADGVDNDTIYTDADALAAVAAAGYLTQTGAFTDAQTLNGQSGSYYLSWDNLTGMPAGFADGMDNDTIYTDVDAVSAIAAAGYVTTTQVQAMLGTADVSWSQLSGVPAGFADGVDNDTLYTDADAVKAIASAGYLTSTQVISVVNQAGYVTANQVVAIITGTGTVSITASNADTLDGQDGSYYLAWGQQTGVPAGFADGIDNDTQYTAGTGLTLAGTAFSVSGAPWGGLTGMPAGFADGVDNDTVYTDAQAIAAVDGIGYLTATQVISTVAAAGYTTADQVMTILTGTGTLTLTVSQAANADLLDGQDGAYYLDASHLNAGTLGTAYYSAAGDLAAEGYLDNNAATDLLMQGQADGRYVNAGETGSVSAPMLVDGATLTEILDDDGAGSGLDADLLDGQSSAYYLAWANQTGVPAGFADGTDNDTTYTAGTGVSLAGTTFSADTAYLQRRVSSTCATGSSIRAIAADGTVTCETDDNAGGDITGVTAGTGLSGGGTTGAVTVSADTTYLQRRVSNACVTGSTIRAIHADGTVLCTVQRPDRAAPGSHTSTVVDNTGTTNAFTIGADGLGLLSYYTGSALRVLHCGDAACTNGNVVSTLVTGGGRDPGITLGADGLGLISHYDATNGDLAVTHCTNITCTTSTTTALDSTGSVGRYTSLMLGADGLALISYYDVTNGDLKVAHCSNTTCTAATVTTLDSTGDVGQYTAIALGGDGLGLISYYDATNGDLKVAHCANTNCTTATLTTVDSHATYNLGNYNALAVGADGLGLIAYRVDNLGVRVLHCGNALCNSGNTITPLDTTNLYPTSLSLTIDAAGLGVVSYGANGLVRIIRCGNLACTTGTLVPLAGAGALGHTSVTLGADGLPLLSYSDGTNLRVAHCVNEFCMAYFRRR